MDISQDHSNEKSVIVVWQQIPEDVEIWIGRVSDAVFKRLTEHHNKYYDDDEDFDADFFFEENSFELRFPEMGLVKITKCQDIFGRLVVTGIYVSNWRYND